MVSSSRPPTYPSTGAEDHPNVDDQFPASRAPRDGIRMDEIGRTEVIEALRPAVADLVEPGSTAAAHAPSRWQAIARAIQPRDRLSL
ncbi:hypothetical protein OHB12_02250 [Nocardia sp. NBC_01730]|uniref:hypothetical protein n=1 Tax=Nocardia sp. NBC_01730 TaxID=2975998 RepID=UPI002E0D47CC|nr:hypothetical protein OHB12_02250 [Nocardia sp. NBC_01730]